MLLEPDIVGYKFLWISTVTFELLWFSIWVLKLETGSFNSWKEHDDALSRIRI
jgi:hypothetical protein